MRVVNLTGGHDLSFFGMDQVTQDPTTKKFVLNDGEQPRLTVPCVGCVRAKRSSICINTMYAGDSDLLLSVNHTAFTDVEGMPSDLEPNTIYIVSALAYNALKASDYAHMDQIFTIDKTVVDGDGRIVGCIDLCHN